MDKHGPEKREMMRHELDERDLYLKMDGPNYAIQYYTSGNKAVICYLIRNYLEKNVTHEYILNTALPENTHFLEFIKR